MLGLPKGTNTCLLVLRCPPEQERQKGLAKKHTRKTRIQVQDTKLPMTWCLGAGPKAEYKPFLFLWFSDKFLVNCGILYSKESGPVDANLKYGGC